LFISLQHGQCACYTITYPPLSLSPTDSQQGVDIQFPFENSPRKTHAANLTIANLYVDKYPVTNAKYAAFITSAHYTPLDFEHYLQHWEHGTVHVLRHNSFFRWM
jgi:formylglycine-generating enzyme required for sulfatase activity